MLRALQAELLKADTVFQSNYNNIGGAYGSIRPTQQNVKHTQATIYSACGIG